MERIYFNRSHAISGTPEQIKTKLLKQADDYGIDEIVVATITYDFQDKIAHTNCWSAFSLTTVNQPTSTEAPQVW